MAGSTDKTMSTNHTWKFFRAGGFDHDAPRERIDRHERTRRRVDRGRRRRYSPNSFSGHMVSAGT